MRFVLDMFLERSLAVSRVTRPLLLASSSPSNTRLFISSSVFSYASTYGGFGYDVLKKG